VADDRIEVKLGADVAEMVDGFSKAASSFRTLQKTVTDSEAVFQAFARVVDGVSLAKSLAGLSEFERAVKVAEEQFRQFASTSSLSAGEIADAVRLVGEAASEGLQFRNFEEITRGLRQIADEAERLSFTGPKAEFREFTAELEKQLQRGEISLDQFQAALDQAGESFGKLDASRIGATLAQFDDAVRKSEISARALGSTAGEVLSEKIGLTESAIRSLIDQGLSPTDAEVTRLSANLSRMKGELEGVDSKAASTANAAKNMAAGFSSSQAAIVTFSTALTAVKAGVDLAVSALRLLADVARETVGEANKDEDALTRLTSALEAAGRASRENIAAFQGQAQAIAEATRNTAGAVIEAQALATQLGILPQEMERTIATAADLAAATGGTLSSAVETIGRAAQGSGRGLQQLGIILDDTGSRSTNLANTLGALEGRVGGAADALGANFAGQLAEVSKQFNEITATVGRFFTGSAELQGIVETLGTGLANINGILAENSDAFGKLAGLVGGIVFDGIILTAQAATLAAKAFAGFVTVITLGNKTFFDLTVALDEVGIELANIKVRAEQARAAADFKKIADDVAKLGSAGKKAADGMAALGDSLGDDLSQKTKAELRTIAADFANATEEIASKASILGDAIFSPLDQSKAAFDAAVQQASKLREALGAAASASPVFVTAMLEVNRAASNLADATAAEGIKKLNEQLRSIGEESGGLAGLTAVEQAVRKNVAAASELAAQYGITGDALVAKLGQVRAATEAAFATEFAANFKKEIEAIKFDTALQGLGAVNGTIVAATHNLGQLAKQAGISAGDIATAMGTAGEAIRTNLQAKNFADTVKGLQSIIDKAREVSFAGPKAELDAYVANAKTQLATGELSIEQYNQKVRSAGDAFRSLSEGQALGVLEQLREAFRQNEAAVDTFGTRVEALGKTTTETADALSLGGEKLGTITKTTQELGTGFEGADDAAAQFGQTLEEQRTAKVDALKAAFDNLNRLGIAPTSKVMEEIRAQINSTNPSLDSLNRLVASMRTEFEQTSTKARESFGAIGEEAAKAAASSGFETLGTKIKTIKDEAGNIKVVIDPAATEAARAAIEGIGTKADEVKAKLGGDAGLPFKLDTAEATTNVGNLKTSVDEITTKFSVPFVFPLDTQAANASLVSLRTILDQIDAKLKGGKFSIDTTEAKAGLEATRRLVDGLAEKLSTSLVLKVDTTQAISELEAAIAELVEQVASTPVTINVETEAALAAIEEVERALETLVSTPRTVTILANLDEFYAAIASIPEPVATRTIRVVAEQSGSPTMHFTDYWKRGGYAEEVLGGFEDRNQQVEVVATGGIGEVDGGTVVEGATVVGGDSAETNEILRGIKKDTDRLYSAWTRGTAASELTKKQEIDDHLRGGS
jgi:hypothetical protein